MKYHVCKICKMWSQLLAPTAVPSVKINLLNRKKKMVMPYEKNKQNTSSIPVFNPFNFSVSCLTDFTVSNVYYLICFTPFYIIIQDWGRPGDLWNLDIRWHVPSVEELSLAFYLLDLFLQPELQRLQRFAKGEQDMIRSGSRSPALDFTYYRNIFFQELWLYI